MPDSTSAKFSRSLRASAPSAAARIQGSCEATRRTSCSPWAAVAAQGRERAQRLAAHDVAGRVEHARGRRDTARIAEAAERAQRLHGDGRVAVARERRQPLDASPCP